MLDVLIRGGWLADGTGNPRYRSDVAEFLTVAREGGTRAELSHLNVIEASLALLDSLHGY